MADDFVEINNQLIDLSFPTSIHDLKNPTEEFVTNVWKEFFSHFSIDLNEVINLSMDQLDALALVEPENAPISTLINLLQGILTFAPYMFIENFKLPEFTSPIAKKMRMRIRIIINYVFFSTGQKEELLNLLKRVFQLHCVIEKSLQQKDVSIEQMNDKAAKTAIKLANAKKKNIESDEIIPSRLRRKNLISNSDKECHFFDEKKSQRYEYIKKRKTEQLKLIEKRDLSVSKIVKNPDEIKDKYLISKTESEDKLKESEYLQGKIKINRPKIENLENAIDCVESQLKIFPECNELHENLTANKLQYEDKVAEINAEINAIDCEESCETQEQVDKIGNNVISKLTAEADKKCKKLKTSVTNLSHENKVIENNFQNIKLKETEISLEVDKGTNRVTELDNVIEKFVIECQELYESEVKKIGETHDKIEIFEEN